MSNTVTRRRFLKIAGTGSAGAALFGGAAVAGSRSGTYLPKGGAKMNVVLVNLDSLRRDHVGAYGNRWIKTPTLDALARGSLNPLKRGAGKPPALIDITPPPPASRLATRRW